MCYNVIFCRLNFPWLCILLYICEKWSVLLTLTPLTTWKLAWVSDKTVCWLHLWSYATAWVYARCLIWHVDNPTMHYLTRIPRNTQPKPYTHYVLIEWLILKIGHVNEYPTMHYFGIPRHTQSMMAYKILTEYFWKSQWKIALWECC